MPNVITPQPLPSPTPPTNSPIPQEVMDFGFTIKNLEFAEYLGLKDDAHNSEVMSKITSLSDYFSDLDALMEADIKLGLRPEMTKLDKIYSYMLLLKQEEDIKNKQDLISKAKNQWEAKPMPPLT